MIQGTNDDYIDINGYAVPYRLIPCSKCRYRYHPTCPVCKWNKDAKFNTYKKMSEAELSYCLHHGKGTATFKEAINAN